MSINLLKKFSPEHTLPYLKKWFGSYRIHIHIARDRHSKLGDYIKLPDDSHKITLNSTLKPELFFFVLTHELAHLLAFEKFGRRIPPHGKEWKLTFGNMILESLPVYKEEARPLLIKFSKSPKANFMASEDLVRYFRPEPETTDGVYIENLAMGEEFIYRKQVYKLIEKRKKNYLCQNLSTDKKYIFKSVTLVQRKRNNGE